ncbi:Transmembrane protein 17B [Blattella germanica]|nr:Transmembrane protein 17B [Blattella germanica]
MELRKGKEGKGSEIISNATLQMSLYFNIYFFPIWLVTVLLMLDLKVPELAGFRMMSLLLQFPLQLFLLVNENTMPFQMEHAVQGIMLSFLVVQIFSGFFFFCCEACFTTSSKLLSQDAVHTSI